MPSTSSSPTSAIGLVLSGGGARGAYQAGVLKAVGEICQIRNISWPFTVMTGLSAGAINITYLASSRTDLYKTTNLLAEIWSAICSSDVFRTDPASLSAIGSRWIASMMSGGWTLSSKPQSLVDTSPLRKLITRYLDTSGITENIKKGKFRAVSVSATDYATSRGVSFVQSGHDQTSWNKPRNYSVASSLGPDHVLASSAIPVLFPAVKIHGKFYGDGCLRNLNPLSPAIRLGAQKLFIIGVRQAPSEHDGLAKDGATAGRILSVLLNAVLMDGLESDVDHLQTINQIVGSSDQKQGQPRFIPTFVMTPSKNIADLAVTFSDSISPFIHFLTRGLGPFEQTAEMISYLLFEPLFCSALIQLGHQDAMIRAREIADFLT